MEKKDVIHLLDEIFIPIGFKRKGNNWVLNGNEINKIINLQKSQYDNASYIKYGYIFNSLPLNGFTDHDLNRLGSIDKNEQIKLTELLNLENNVEPYTRISELKESITKLIVNQMQSTHLPISMTLRLCATTFSKMMVLMHIPPTKNV